MGGRRFDRTGWAMEQEGLTCAQKSVLIIVADASDEVRGVCWLKHATIGARTSLGLTAVRSAIRALVEMELLRVASRLDKTGRQTSNYYQLGCYEPEDEIDWRVSGDDTLRVDEGIGRRQGEVSGDDTSIVNQPERLTQLLASDKMTTSSLSSGERAPRRTRRKSPLDEFTEAQGDTTNLPWGTEPPEAEDTRPRRRRSTGPTNPDSAWGLARYWADKCLLAGWLTGRKETIVRHHMSLWLKAGATPDLVRAMVDLFVTDPQYHTTDFRWKKFVANAESLQARVLARKPALRAVTPAEDNWLDRLPPELLAAIEAEAEDVA